jgi:glutamate formiminotransferase / 5-formyltetrahydrofolate cyclo-ligase
MPKIIECIPNFSEGRNQDVINALANEAKKVPGIKLLNINTDQSYNRTVLTFIGEPGPVKTAAFNCTAKAAELIDMEKHRGQHPRIGATDVIPLVPISEMTLEECVVIANELGVEIAKKLGIPIYMYEKAAKIPERTKLQDVRRGEYEALKNEINNPERRPDYGKPVMHPKAGATAIGVRPALIAYNINLSTTDISIAKKIAQYLREAKGSFKDSRAIGVFIKERNMAQVSIMINPKYVSMYRIFELVKIEAARYGVNIIGSEICGLVSRDAIYEAIEYYLRLENFDPKQVLEDNL